MFDDEMSGLLVTYRLQLILLSNIFDSQNMTKVIITKYLGWNYFSYDVKHASAIQFLAL